MSEEYAEQFLNQLFGGAAEKFLKDLDNIKYLLSEPGEVEGKFVTKKDIIDVSKGVLKNYAEAKDIPSDIRGTIKGYVEGSLTSKEALDLIEGAEKVYLKVLEKRGINLSSLKL